MAFIVFDTPKPGEHWTDGHREIVIARVIDAFGEKRVWFSRADGRTVTYGTSETWLYESEFHPRFTRIP